LWHGQRMIDLNSAGVRFGAGADAGGIWDLGLVGMSLELNSARNSIEMVPYLGSGFLVSEADPMQRVVKSLAAWADLRRRHRQEEAAGEAGGS
jgi:hypothetical protein